MVLLKNDGALPLSADQNALFVGEFAKKPRYQGGGSSHINPYKVTGAIEAAPEGVRFVQGYLNDTEEKQEELLKEVIDAAKEADKVVVFAGLPESYESEGYDRTHMHLPENQNKLIHELTKINPQVIVVLHNGSPVEMPWADDVNAILETYLGGEAVGAATVLVLYGDVNPSLGDSSRNLPLKKGIVVIAEKELPIGLTVDPGA